MDPNTGNLKKMIEKPVLDYLVNTGFYVLSPSVLNLIPSNKKFEMNELIERVNKKKINIYPIHNDDWIDIGEWSEYHKAAKTIW